MALLTDLEQATEGSRELDQNIRLRVVADKLATGTDGEEVRREMGGWHLTDSDANVPHYTTNLQDALLLVPEDDEVWWEVRQMCSPRSPMRNFGTNNGLFHARVGLNYGEDGFLGHHDRPALALCIACLRTMEGT